ncbi:MAG: STAS domain-containing protein [Terriglobia bacterium]
MPAKAVWLEIDGEFVARALQEALKKLNGAGGEVVLDFSSVHRIDASALRAMESFVSTVDGKAKLALQGVNIDVYKVLKLMKLSRRFSFLT